MIKKVMVDVHGCPGKKKPLVWSIVICGGECSTAVGGQNGFDNS